MPIQSFKEIIDSNDPEKVKSFLDSGESWAVISEDTEILQYCLEKKSDIGIFKLIFDRLKNSKKDKAINKISKDGNLTLFLALDAGQDYFEVFKNYENIDWFIFGKNGNNLLHHALSLKNVSEESLNFLYEKLSGYECLFKINDNSENALHCAANLKNFKWCINKCKSSDPSKVKPLLHSVNKVGETPVVKLLLKKLDEAEALLKKLKDKKSLDEALLKELKDEELLGEALLKEITDVLRKNEYDFLKTDNNEQNAISLAVQNSYNENQPKIKHKESVLLEPFLSDENDSYKKEKNEIIFSAIEHGKDGLLKSLKQDPEKKGDFIVQNFEDLAQKYPKRLANLIVNNQSILSDCIKLYETRNGHFTSDKLFSVLRRMMYLAVDHTNNKLTDQCLAKYRLLKNYVLFYEKNLVIPDLLERQNSTDETLLDYSYRNNPEMFARLVRRLPKFNSDSSANQESHQVNQKEKITSSITDLFTSENSYGWYDTGGILASLADLVIKQNDDSPKIFVQSATHGQQRSLSDELKEVSKCGKDVIYIRCSPINEKGESSRHWTVLYFSQGKNGASNLLVVDPYGTNEPSAVIKEAAKGIVGSIYVSTTKIQHDSNSCGPISSEVARAIYSQKGKLQELLEGNNQKIDIEQILPNGLIKDAKENGKVDYGRGVKNFNCSKIRNAHVQIAQVIGGAILDKIPSQLLINKILTGEENSSAEKTVTLNHNLVERIIDSCKENEEKTCKVISILGDNKTNDDSVIINLKQIKELEEILGEQDFKPIKEEMLFPQPQLNNEQEERIKQVRRNLELELTNTAPQKYKSNDSLLYKFLCSAAVGDIEQFFGSNNNPGKGEDLIKAAFTAARNGDISRLEVFIKCKSNVIYEKDISDKSLLEVAAENFHPEVVQYIIRKHNEIYKKQNDKTADAVSRKFLGFVGNIDNRKDPWAKDLAKELKRILKKKDFDETDGLKIDRIFSPYIKNKEMQEKTVKNFNTNDYGNLSSYADVLKSGNTEKFKTTLEEIDPKHNLYSLLNSGGHNLITLTAALGKLDHWKEIERAYSKVEGRATIPASLDNISPVGSPIQAAIIANNLPMFNHFLDLKDEFIINKRYGAEKNNILHTILQSDEAELLNDIISKFKDNKEPFIKALQQVNKDNKSPLDLALEKGHYGFFERALDAVVSDNKKNIKDLLIANYSELIKSAVSFGNERIIGRIFSLQDEYNKGAKRKENQLNLLNYNNHYDKKNRLEQSWLLNIACEHNNVETASAILEMLRKRQNKARDKLSVLERQKKADSSYSEQKEELVSIQGIIKEAEKFIGDNRLIIHNEEQAYIPKHLKKYQKLRDDKIKELKITEKEIEKVQEELDCITKAENTEIMCILANTLTALISKDFDSKEVFDFLFNQGINFDALSKAQYSPVYKAVEYCNISALKYFINEFPESNVLNLQDESGRTPLHLAISNGDRKIVEFLIENGADFDKSDNRNVTPFELASENNRFADICIDLLKHNPKAIIRRAISSGNKSLIENLIDRNDWVLDERDRDNATRNHDFINKETTLKFALRRGIDEGSTAKIAEKSIENFKELVKEKESGKELQKNLLKLGFLNDVVKSGIYNPSKEGSKKAGEVSEFIKSEIKKDGSLLSVTSQGTTLLHDIVSSNNFDLFANIESYIEYDIIAKKSGELEEIALHAAVRSGNPNIVKTIVEKAGDQENIKLAVNEYNAKGYTPFQIAAQLGNWEIYNLLKERDGDLKSKTKDGNSIAHLLILSAMKDPIDGSYEYQKLLKDYQELANSVNNKEDGLLAAAARCTKQDKASEIMEQLLENEFKRKKNQLTEEDQIRLLSNAIASNNFSAVREVVLGNTKVPFASKVASAIAGDDTDKTPQANVRRTIAHTIAPKKNVHGTNEARVLSQSIQKALLSTEQQKQSLLQNVLNLLHIKTQKGSSNKVDTDALLNFLIQDQNSYAKSIDDFPLVEEEVKVSHARKDIFVRQKELNQKLDNFLKQKLEYPSWEEQKERNEDKITQLQNSEYTLKICGSIVDAIDTSNSIDDAIEIVCNHYFQNNPNQNPNEIIYNGVTRRQCVIDDIKFVIKDNGYIDFTLYYQNFKGAQSEEDRTKEKKTLLKYIDNEHNSLKSKLNDCHQQITELNKKIGNYQLDAYNLSKIKVPQDVLYTNCRDLDGKSIANRIFTSNELPFIKEVILENENLWDPRFVDSEGNTLLHKLAQMIEKDKKDSALKDYIQPLIDRGFSLTRKNNNGKSAKDIFERELPKVYDEDEKEDAEKRIADLGKSAKVEEQAQKHFEKGLNFLLENGSIDYLANIIRNGESYKQYYGTIFNLLHDVVSSCFNSDLSNDYLFNKRFSCFKELFKSSDLRAALDKTNEKRCNFLHKAIEEATNNHSGSSTNKMLKKILLDVARGLNSSRNFKLCNELFFKQRNSEGDNVIEALSKVQNSLDIFKELEKEFSRNAFADECDLNLVLVNAAGSKNSSLFEHVIENYRLNRFRTPSEEGQLPLHAAVVSGDQKTVLAVLKSGANINQINSSGRTALHELLIFLRNNPGSQEHAGLVDYLASRGAFFGHYQKEGENKGGEVSEVIESMDEDIQKKVLFNIARGRSGFYDLKHILLSEAENFIKSKNKSGPLVVDLDVGGSTAFVQINNGKFKNSKFLNSGICKSNHLTTSYFDVDGCKGYVQKSVSGKRNYVVFEDAIDGERKSHPTKIKVWLSKEQSITVLVSADGTIEPAKISHKVMGVEIKDDLSEYRERKEEFKKNHEGYKGYIEKLWEKVDSQNEYKNDVYIGGIPLKEALMQGCWRDKGLQRQTQENKMLEEIRKSPEDHDMPSYSKRNSKDDGVGETIEDAQDPGKIGQNLSQLQSTPNNATTANSKDGAFGATEEEKKNFYEGAKEAIEGIAEGLKDIVNESEQALSNRKTNLNLADNNVNSSNVNTPDLGYESGGESPVQEEKGISGKLENIQSQKKHPNFDEFMTELKERLAQPNKGLKSTPSQMQHSDSDKVVSELEQRFTQPNKGLKSTPSQMQHSDSDKVVSELEQRFTQPNKGLKSTPPQVHNSDLNKLESELGQRSTLLKMGLKEVDPSKINSESLKRLVSDGLLSGEDEKRKVFYEAVKKVAEGLKDVMGEALSDKKASLSLNINPDNNMNGNNLDTPESGYGSTVGSPTQEGKGIKDSYESEKSKIDVGYYRLPSKKHIIEDSGIELDDIELAIEEQKGISSTRKVFGQEKGIEDSYIRETKRCK